MGVPAPQSGNPSSCGFGDPSPQRGQRRSPSDQPQCSPCLKYVRTITVSTRLGREEENSSPTSGEQSRSQTGDQRGEGKETRGLGAGWGKAGAQWLSPPPGHQGCHSPLRSAAPPRMILATTTAPECSSRRMVAPCIGDRADRLFRGSPKPQTPSLWTPQSLPVSPSPQRAHQGQPFPALRMRETSLSC